jgi:uncharacterized membrane protein YccC
MTWDPVAVSATIGGCLVAAVVVWGIFGVARTAVAADGSEAHRKAVEELAETHRQLLEGQREAAAVLAELRGSVTRIEAMLKEVG